MQVCYMTFAAKHIAAFKGIKFDVFGTIFFQTSSAATIDHLLNVLYDQRPNKG